MHPAPERMFCAHELTYAYWCPQGAYGDVTCSYRRDSRGHDASAWNGVDYLQALYADGLRGHFDAVGWHPYNYWNHATAVQMLAYHRCSAWTQLASTRVSVRSLMAGHADGRKRIWITETGAPTCVPGATYGCVTPAQQARLAASEARLWHRLSWAGGFYWYDIRDDHAASPAVEQHFGTVSWPGSPKPAYGRRCRTGQPTALRSVSHSPIQQTLSQPPPLVPCRKASRIVSASAVP
jgi:polysaccharide biosynthesis protein PslG